MALFQKKPQLSDNLPLYSLGLNKTVLIVGLGNIGKEYQGTRHNIGFTAVEAFVNNQELSSWISKKDLKCVESTGTIGSTRVIVAKPSTYMNNSGVAVQAIMHFYKIPIDRVIVIHDELDIPFGQIRIRIGGSSAGHNGIKSIIQTVSEDFGRIRIGIGNSKITPENGADFVLSKFTKKESQEISALTKEVVAILTEYIFGEKLPVETRNFII